MASKAVLFLSWCLLLGTCGMMSSCDAENTISTEYPCHFIFYTQARSTTLGESTPPSMMARTRSKPSP